MASRALGARRLRMERSANTCSCGWWLVVGGGGEQLLLLLHLTHPCPDCFAFIHDHHTSSVIRALQAFLFFPHIYEGLVACEYIFELG